MGIFRAPKTILILSVVFIITKVFVQSILGMSSRWLSTAPLQKELVNSAVVSDGKSIYFIGGGLTPATPNDSPVPTKDVYRAQLLENGRLSDWSLVTPLLDPLVGHAAVITKSIIYVIGGVRGLTENDLSRDTMYATIQADGSLSPWTRSNYELPIGISTHSAVVAGDYIYIFGGYNGSQASSLKSVYRSRIFTDGTIGEWEPLLNMSQSVYRHTSIVYENKVYIIGGRERLGDFKKPLNSVYIGQIGSDGKINNWSPTEALFPPGLYFHGSIISEAEKKIYTFGGYNGSLATDKVYSAKLKLDGTLEPWLEVEDFRLPKELFRHSVILANNGSVYLLGGEYNNSNINEVYYLPPLSLTKSADPPGSVHEGNVITYTIAYTNTSLTTQTITVTDQIPFNVTLEPGSISSPGYQQGSQIIWPIGETAPGYSSQVSFRVRVPLFLSSGQLSTSAMSLQPSGSASYVLPVPVSCDTTRFWANGVTIQPPPSGAYTFNIQLPPGSNPSETWLLMKGINHSPPLVEGQPAQQIMTSTKSFSASLWSAAITPAMTPTNQIAIVTPNPRELNAVFLFDQNDPPFDKTKLEDFYKTTRTFTYTLDLPSVMTRTMDVIMPVMDITYLTDNTPPQVDTRMTTITVEFDDQRHTVRANNPNMGNGLLMTQFPFDIGAIPGSLVATKTLTVTIDTEDSVYILGPRICRPVYIENTAWLCSDKAGCISATARNLPPNPRYPNGIYLPIILK